MDNVVRFVEMMERARRIGAFLERWSAWAMALLGIVFAWWVTAPHKGHHHDLRFDWWKLVLAVLGAWAATAHQEIFRGSTRIKRKKGQRFARYKVDHKGRAKHFASRMLSSFAYGYLSGSGFGL